MTLKYEIITKSEIKENHRQIVASMLEEQQKVEPPYYRKADRCKFICIVSNSSIPIALGAIKMKTESDFTHEKANLVELSEKFDWELGYLYVNEKYKRRGIASNIVSMLLECFGDGNLMASTEITANPSMMKILERFGFRHYGNPWQSDIHKNYLGLFLRFR